MRELGPFDKNVPRREARATKNWPKPDFVAARLTQQELHAYYIALISSAWLCAAPDGLRLKTPS